MALYAGSLALQQELYEQRPIRIRMDACGASTTNMLTALHNTLRLPIRRIQVYLRTIHQLNLSVGECCIRRGPAFSQAWCTLDRLQQPEVRTYTAFLHDPAAMSGSDRAASPSP